MYHYCKGTTHVVSLDVTMSIKTPFSPDNLYLRGLRGGTGTEGGVGGAIPHHFSGRRVLIGYLYCMIVDSSNYSNYWVQS